MPTFWVTVTMSNIDRLGGLLLYSIDSEAKWVQSFGHCPAGVTTVSND